MDLMFEVYGQRVVFVQPKSRKMAAASSQAPHLQGPPKEAQQNPELAQCERPLRIAQLLQAPTTSTPEACARCAVIAPPCQPTQGGIGHDKVGLQRLLVQALQKSLDPRAASADSASLSIPEAFRPNICSAYNLVAVYLVFLQLPR